MVTISGERVRIANSKACFRGQQTEQQSSREYATCIVVLILHHALPSSGLSALGAKILAASGTAVRLAQLGANQGAET